MCICLAMVAMGILNCSLIRPTSSILECYMLFNVVISLNSNHHCHVCWVFKLWTTCILNNNMLIFCKIRWSIAIWTSSNFNIFCLLLCYFTFLSMKCWVFFWLGRFWLALCVCDPLNYTYITKLAQFTLHPKFLSTNIPFAKDKLISLFVMIDLWYTLGHNSST
jgi:hypothetical protein